MFYLPTKCEVKLWTDKVTVVIFVPLSVIWLKVLGRHRPGVLLASGSSVRIGLSSQAKTFHIDDCRRRVV